FLDGIYALTEGNPFFIEEVLRSLLSSDEIAGVDEAWQRRPLAELHIPRTVQDAVGRRTCRLSTAARDLLVLAAVAGQRCDFALLEDLTGHDERRLLRLLKELIDAQLMVEESADRFTFRHALTREAVRGEILARERRTLHGQIAAAIEARYP